MQIIGYRKHFILLLIIVLLSSMIACQDTGQKDVGEDIMIGVVVYDEYDTFLNGLMDSFMNEVANQIKEGTSITVKRYNAAGSQITENEQVEEMISLGCDVICVNLVDRTDPSMIIEMAKKADVPVIFFNRELVEKDLDSWKRLYYVGADAFESGRLEGEIAADLWLQNSEYDKNRDGVLQYVVLEGEAGHQDAIVRSEYSVNALVDANINIDKLASAIANWNRAQAKNKINQFYHKYEDDIELILCNNDDMALGAIDEYKALSIPKNKRPIILGIDGTDVGLEAVVNGDMQGTVYNNKEGQAYSMLHLAIAAVRGEGFDELELFDGKYIRYPYSKITKENIEEYLKEAE